MKRLAVLVAATLLYGVAHAASVNLAWDAPTDTTGIVGYEVGVGAASGSYGSFVDAGNALTVTVPNLSDGVTYYFAARAYDAAGTRSGYSNEVAYTTQATPPSASFSVNPSAGVAPLTVQFSNLSTGTISTYAWVFGDGGTSSIASPSHLYQNAGSYSATLTVSGAAGSSTSQPTVINVSSPPAGSNLAPLGVAYRWYGNASATSNANRTAAAGLNDGNLATDVVLSGGGGDVLAAYEAGGVVWSSAQTVDTVRFVNGTWNGSSGDGAFSANLSLQFTTDGTTWGASGWPVSPAYPYSSSATSGATYTFAGTAASVRGVRVVGQVHTADNTSWWAGLREVQTYYLGSAPPQDTTPPQVTIASPANGSVYRRGSVSINASATDNVGVVAMTLAIDGVQKTTVAGAALTYSWSIKNVATGQHVIAVTAKDAAGNSAAGSVTVTKK